MNWLVILLNLNILKLSFSKRFKINDFKGVRICKEKLPLLMGCIDSQKHIIYAFSHSVACSLGIFCEVYYLPALNIDLIDFLAGIFYSLSEKVGFSLFSEIIRLKSVIVTNELLRKPVFFNPFSIFFVHDD